MSIEYVKDDHINDNIITIQKQIDDCIIQFMKDQSINDLKEITQSVWNGMLMFINYSLFKNTNRLKKIPDIANNLLNGGLQNNNAYNTDLLNDIADYYIYLCRLNEKECSIVGFSYLVGMDNSTIHRWLNDKASSTGYDIGKKLQAENENSLSDKLLTGKNPVGVLAILNHRHNWAGVGNMKVDEMKRAATLDYVRKNAALLSDNLTADGQQISEKQPLELSDNLTQLESQ